MSLSGFARNIFKFALTRIVWLTRSAADANYEDIKVNILVVKKSIYSRLAQICVESFLHFHPRASIQIHFDSETERQVLRRFKALRFFRRADISFRRISDTLSWQESKLDLIFSLNGTSELYLDCDLRWNGPLNLKKMNSLLYFVKENPLDTFQNILFLIPDEYMRFLYAPMKNTSLFSWNQLKLKDHDLLEFRLLQQKIFKNATHAELSVGKDFARLAEQITLSLIQIGRAHV